jgi:catalase
MVELLTNVDHRLASEVATAIGVKAPPSGDGRVAALESLRQGWQRYGVTDLPGERRTEDGAVAPEVSQTNTIKGSIKTRKVAVLAADGFDQAALTALTTALAAGGAKVETVSLRLGQIRGADGQPVKVDKTLLTAGSIMYDGVFVVGGRPSVDTLKMEGDALHFINEAYRHCKPIGATGEGTELIKDSDVERQTGNGRAGNGRAGGNGNGHNGRQPDLQGVIRGGQASDTSTAVQQFVESLGQHRFFARLRKERVPA